MRRRFLVAALGVALSFGVARAQDYSGTWDVSGQDPALGPFAGWAAVRRTATGYELDRLVEVQRKLPDGRTLVLAWRGTARPEQGGLRIDVSLRRQDFVQSAAGLARGPADKTPLAITALLQDPNGPVAFVQPGLAIQGRFLSAGPVNGATESWVRVNRVIATPFPWVERTRAPAHAPSSILRSAFFLLFRSYHQLPAVQPFTARPEFKDAVHFTVAATTGRDYARAHGDHLLVVQKVADEIALVEEDMRASAFRWRLFEKARGFDDSIEKDLTDPVTGMIGAVDLASNQRHPSGDGALHQGCWVASQAWRFEATNDPRALDDVARGTATLVKICDAPGDPKEFARAVHGASTLANATGWLPSPVLPGVVFKAGGNNDMMHGVDYGFTMAEQVLPSGHPLLADMGARAKTLVENNKVARSGSHQILLAGLAARLTGDAKMKSLYRKKVWWSPLERLWMLAGEGILSVQGIGDWSGHHLGTCTLASFTVLGGRSPSFIDQTWRWTARTGARAAFANERIWRPGLVSVLGAASGAGPQAAQLGKDVLAEIPYPKQAGASVQIDRSIEPSFCLSPYPSLPWKNDWTTNAGRQQSIESSPLFERGETDNYWKENPLGSWSSGVGSLRHPAQDYLHAYWLGRATGVISPAD